jgi:cbb3-type cytochrome oxidase maturation protein
MEVLTILIPVSLLLGLGGLVAFVWSLRKGMYDDPDGDSQRILNPDYDDKPKPIKSTVSVGKKRNG